MSNSVNITIGELSAICGVLTFIGGLATAYLRLAMGKALQELKDNLLAEMKGSFVSKDALQPMLHDIKKAITRNESHVVQLQDKCHGIDIRIAKIERNQ